jgi:hypothetical protein
MHLNINNVGFGLHSFYALQQVVNFLKKGCNGEINDFTRNQRPMTGFQLPL